MRLRMLSKQRQTLAEAEPEACEALARAAAPSGIDGVFQGFARLEGR